MVLGDRLEERGLIQTIGHKPSRQESSPRSLLFYIKFMNILKVMSLPRTPSFQHYYRLYL
jgi:hypothetical protein